MTSVFRELCVELARSLTPALVSAGFAPPADPFSPEHVRYDFRRPSSSGTHTFSVLFNKYRHPQFGVQLFIEPAAGLTALQTRGGTLLLGGLSATPVHWPLGVRPFVAAPSSLQVLAFRRKASPAVAVQSLLALLPEVEQWWLSQRSSKHILTSRAEFKGGSRAV